MSCPECTEAMQAHAAWTKATHSHRKDTKGLLWKTLAIIDPEVSVPSLCLRLCSGTT